MFGAKLFSYVMIMVVEVQIIVGLRVEAEIAKEVIESLAYEYSLKLCLPEFPIIIMEEEDIALFFAETDQETIEKMKKDDFIDFVSAEPKFFDSLEPDDIPPADDPILGKDSRDVQKLERLFRRDVEL